MSGSNSVAANAAPLSDDVSANAAQPAAASEQPPPVAVGYTYNTSLTSLCCFLCFVSSQHMIRLRNDLQIINLKYVCMLGRQCEL